MRKLLRRFVKADDGQDIVEYALLAALVGLAGLAALNQVQTAVGNAYTAWGSNTQELSCMPAPGGGTCP